MILDNKFIKSMAYGSAIPVLVYFTYKAFKLESFILSFFVGLSAIYFIIYSIREFYPSYWPKPKFKLRRK